MYATIKMAKIRSLPIKAKLAVQTGIMYGMLGMTATCGGKKYTVPDDVDAADMISSVIGFILQMISYIGAVLLIWGCTQLFLAMKQDDADSKAKAIMVIVASIGMCGLGPLLQAAGILN